MVDARLGELIGQLKLAPDWRERALAAVHADVDRDAIQAERDRILRRLDKIRKFTLAEIMAPDEYEREKAELMDRLSRLTLPAEVDLDAAAAVLEDLQGLWTHPATATEDRAAICRRLLRSVVVDTNDDTIKEIHLREELAPLFAVLPAQVYARLCHFCAIRAAQCRAERPLA